MKWKTLTDSYPNDPDDLFVDELEEFVEFAHVFQNEEPVDMTIVLILGIRRFALCDDLCPPSLGVRRPSQTERVIYLENGST